MDQQHYSLYILACSQGVFLGAVLFPDCQRTYTDKLVKVIVDIGKCFFVDDNRLSMRYIVPELNEFVNSLAGALVFEKDYSKTFTNYIKFALR